MKLYATITSDRKGRPAHKGGDKTITCTFAQQMPVCDVHYTAENELIIHYEEGLKIKILNLTKDEKESRIVNL